MLGALKAAGIACIPVIPTLITMIACPVDQKAGSVVKFRPPPVIFSIMWPLLFVGLGVAFYRLDNKWPILILSVLLAMWQVLYSSKCGGNKKRACWCLLACCFVGFVALSFGICESDAVSIVALSALLAWLHFAQQINSAEVQLS
jgi:tryptophan-rich sensory protein